MRIEELIRKYPSKWGLLFSEYIIKVQRDENGELEVYVRPSDRDGETENFIIKDNIFFPRGFTDTDHAPKTPIV